MKTGSLLLMLFGILLILGYGAMSMLGFAMSFDAPGSENDPTAWLNRFLFFGAPIIVMIVILIMALAAYNKGNYKKSFWIGSLFGFGLVAAVIFLTADAYLSTAKFRALDHQQAMDEKHYPIEKYIRPLTVGADTVIVFPFRIVAYRLYTGEQYPYGGPVGDLNLKRDTIILDFDPDTRLQRDELSQFLDAKGRRLTDVYAIK